MFAFANSVVVFLFGGIGNQAAFNLFPNMRQEQPVRPSSTPRNNRRRSPKASATISIQNRGNTARDLEGTRQQLLNISQPHAQFTNPSSSDSVIDDGYYHTYSDSSSNSSASKLSLSHSSSTTSTSITANSPPPHPRPWLWQCHHCFLYYPIHVRRCVDELCGHNRCTRSSPSPHRASKSHHSSSRKARYINWLYPSKEWAIPNWVDGYADVPVYALIKGGRRQRKESQRRRSYSSAWSTEAVQGDQHGTDHKKNSNDIGEKSAFTLGLEILNQIDFEGNPIFGSPKANTTETAQPIESSFGHRSSSKDICLDSIRNVELRFLVKRVHELVTEDRPHMQITIKECMQAVNANDWKIDSAVASIIGSHEPVQPITATPEADFQHRDTSERKSVDTISPAEQELVHERFLELQEELCEEILHADDPEPEEEGQIEKTTQDPVALPGVIATIESTTSSHIDINNSSREGSNNCLEKGVKNPTPNGPTLNFQQMLEDEIGILSQEEFADIENKNYARLQNRLADEELQRAIHISVGDRVEDSPRLQTPRKPTPKSIARYYQELYGDDVSSSSDTASPSPASSSSSRESSPETNPEDVAVAYQRLWGTTSPSGSASRESTPDSVLDVLTQDTSRESTTNSVSGNQPTRHALATIEDFLRSDDATSLRATANGPYTTDTPIFHHHPSAPIQQPDPPSSRHQDFLSQQRGLIIAKCKVAKYKIPIYPTNQPEVISSSKKRKFIEEILPKGPEDETYPTFTGTWNHPEPCCDDPPSTTSTSTKDPDNLPGPNGTAQKDSLPESPRPARKRKKPTPGLCGEFFDYDGWDLMGDYYRPEKRRRQEIFAEQEMKEQRIWQDRFDELFSSDITHTTYTPNTIATENGTNREGYSRETTTPSPTLKAEQEEHLRKRPRLTDRDSESIQDCSKDCDYPGQCARKRRSVTKEREEHAEMARKPYSHWRVRNPKTGRWNWHQNEGHGYRR